MSYILRDLPPAIVQIDTETIRATKGTSELITRPSITIPACYAIPRASSSKLDSTSEPNGDAVAVESTGESRSSWITGDQLSKARSESDFEAKWDLKYPFRESKAAEDWVGREYIFQHLLTLLDVKTAANLSPLLLVPAPSPPSLPLDLQALYTQLAFETLNVPGLSILPSPLATVYALGVTSGVVLHIGWETSEVFVVTDSIVRWECSTTAAVGAKHCEEFFEKLLLADSALDTELSMAAGRGSEVDWEAGQKEALIKEVCSVVWNECTGEDIQVPPIKGVNAIVSGTSAEADESNFDVAKKLVGDPVAPAPASHKKKVPPPRPAAASAAAAAASAPAQVAEDLIAINIPSLPGKDIALGPVRHRLCEPLLLGLEKGSDTVWEGMGRAVESSALNLVERLSLWDAVCVVGDLARIKSFSPSLTTYLAPYLLSSSDVPSDLQPAKVRLLSIPDYFGNYKGSTTDLAPFLGASMVARAAFNDSLGKHCITKADYDDKGPAAIYITGGSDDR